jgi:hypothetical protein
LKEDPGVKKIDEGSLIVIDNNYATPLYSLTTPYPVTGDSNSFYILYTSDAKTQLELFFGDSIKKEIELPFSKNTIRFQIPVSNGDMITGFRVKMAGSEDGKINFKILNTGVEETSSAFLIKNQIEGKEIVLRNGFSINGPGNYNFSALSEEADTLFNQLRLTITYEYTGKGKTEFEIILFSANSSKEYGLNPRKGSTVLSFYSDSIGFVPTGFRVVNYDSDLIIKNVDISSFSTMVSMDYTPITADIGTMLDYSQSAWRRSDFEIFSWNLFPDILVIDFRDYILQAASLKRLSFFVEKEGFTGKLLNNETLSKLHGWNAHDYRADDLAVFFTLAEKQNFNLNTEEYEVLDILISNKIIEKTNKGYEPVSGGILSYSMESSPRLRRLFITHEGYHGVFFSDLDFANEIQLIWNSLEEAEKHFWYDFLLWKRYETENPYLVMNEFMAYLMQQSISNIESYYKDYLIPKFLIANPDKSETINNFLINYPDHFLENARKVEEAVFRLNTISAGELRCIY